MNGRNLDIVEEADQASSASEIKSSIDQRKPFVIRGLDVGSCTRRWTDVGYLKAKTSDKTVSAHVAAEGKLDFLKKNFKYQTMSMAEFLCNCISGPPVTFYYLRSTAQEARTGVANIEKDFPGLWPDVTIPSFVPKDKVFSSVLRAGSEGVSVWTHYDVMDNILVQVTGRKKVILFPPSDVPHLYLREDKSRVVDMQDPDLAAFPLLARATCYTGVLEPGDVLFIPALWFHTTVHLTFGIGFNLFWHHLDRSMYDPKDLYGNKDPLPARDAFQGLNKALHRLDKLPSDHRIFYALRMAEEAKKYVELQTVNDDS